MSTMKTPATLNTSDMIYVVKRGLFGVYYVSPVEKKVDSIFRFAVSFMLDVL